MLSLIALASTVSAASNAFTNPVTNITIQTGNNLNITWQNASGSVVDIVLRSGEARDLKYVATVGTAIPNQGQYIWAVPSNLTTGEYALEITSDSDAENYSSIFTIIGDEVSVNANATTTTTSSSSSSSSSVVTTTSVAYINGTTNGTSTPTTSSYATITGFSNASSAISFSNGTSTKPVTTSAPGFIQNNITALPSTSASHHSNNSNTSNTARVLNGASTVSGSTIAVGAALAGAALLLL